MKHAYFGTAPCEWTRTIVVRDHQVSSDLNCTGDVTAAQLDAVAPFVQKASDFDARARAAMATVGEDDGAVGQYFEHHVAELSDDEFLRIFRTKVRSEVSRAQMLAGIQLVRIGLYPAAEHATAVFDYSIDVTATNYILAVSFDALGDVSSIAMES